MTFHSYGISLPCCTSSCPLALVVCGICPVACDTLLCATQRGNVFPSCFCFFCYNHCKFIKIPSQIQPSCPLFFAKEPLFVVFFYTIAGNPVPRAMPHRSLVPNSSLCIPRNDAAASGWGRNALPDDPSHGKTKKRSALHGHTQRAAMANAMRCMGTCTALRFRGQNCGALAAADRGSESQALPMPEERLPRHHHLRRLGWTKAVTGQKNRSAPPRLPHWPRKTGMVRR